MEESRANTFSFLVTPENLCCILNFSSKCLSYLKSKYHEEIDSYLLIQSGSLEYA